MSTDACWCHTTRNVVKNTTKTHMHFCISVHPYVKTCIRGPYDRVTPQGDNCEIGTKLCHPISGSDWTKTPVAESLGVSVTKVAGFKVLKILSVIIVFSASSCSMQGYGPIRTSGPKTIGAMGGKDAAGTGLLALHCTWWCHRATSVPKRLIKVALGGGCTDGGSLLNQGVR